MSETTMVNFRMDTVLDKTRRERGFNGGICMKRLISIFIAIMMFSFGALAEDQVDSVELYSDLYTLWDVPFGLPANEMVATVRANTGIQLFKNEDVYRIYSGDDEFYVPADDQEIFLMGVPLESLSMSCSSEIAPYGTRDDSQTYLLKNPVYVVAWLRFSEFSYDIDEESSWEEATEMCLADGISQFNTFLSGLWQKYGAPTLAFVEYNEGSALSEKVEYQGNIYFAPEKIFTIEFTDALIDSSVLMDTINWELDNRETIMDIEIQFENITLTGSYSSSYFNCRWKNTITFGVQDNHDRYELHATIADLYTQSMAYDKNVDVSF